MKNKIILIVVFLILFPRNALAYEKGNYKAAVLLEANSGKILYEYNKDSQLPQASLTKLMTYYVIEDFIKNNNINLDRIINIDLDGTRMDSSWSQIGLRDGESMSLRNLIRSLLIVSANDSALALEKFYEDSRLEKNDFIKAMNDKAAELEMNKTLYINSTGLTNRKSNKSYYNVTSAYDTAVLATRLLREYAGITEITKTKYFNYKGTNYKNWNLLLWNNPNVDGLKTGHTDEAGYCLLSTEDLTKDNGAGKPFRLVAVILGAPDENGRVNESLRLLKYGEDNFQNKIAVKKGDLFKFDNEFYKEGYVEGKVADDIYLLSEKGDNIEKNIIVYKELPKNIKEGEVIGTIEIKNNRTNEIRVEKIYASKDFYSISILKRILIFIKHLFE